VGSKQTDLPSYRPRLAAFFVLQWLVMAEQQGSQVAVSEAVDAELASAYRLKQRSVFWGVGIEGPEALSVPYYGAARPVSEVFGWDGVLC
jgi:hypothetical protein